MKIHRAFAGLTSLILVLCGAGSVWRGLHFKGLNLCAANLKMIASAKGSYGLEHKLVRGQEVFPEQIYRDWMKEWNKLRCPAGGVYAPRLFTGDKDAGDALHAPSCSVHGSLAALPSMNRDFNDPTPYFIASTVCFGLVTLMALVYLAAIRKTRRKTIA